MEKSHTRRCLTPARLQRLPLRRDHRQRSARDRARLPTCTIAVFEDSISENCRELAVWACKQTSGSSCVVTRKSWTQSPENTHVQHVGCSLLAAAHAQAKLKRIRIAHSRFGCAIASSIALTSWACVIRFCTCRRSEPALPGRLFPAGTWPPSRTLRWPGSTGFAPSSTTCQ